MTVRERSDLSADPVRPFTLEVRVQGGTDGWPHAQVNLNGTTVVFSAVVPRAELRAELERAVGRAVDFAVLPR
jgi:hypothetical protein